MPSRVKVRAAENRLSCLCKSIAKALTQGTFKC